MPKSVYVTVNDVTCIIARYLRPTRLNNLYLFNGIAHPDIKRKVAVDIDVRSNHINFITTV